MFSTYSSTQLGEAIRMFRKKKGLRIHDISDENISTGTVHNIEKGEKHVKMSSVEYVMKKIGLSKQQLEQLLKGGKYTAQKLRRIETLLDLGLSEKSFKALSLIDLNKDNENMSLYHYILGKYYKSSRSWKQACREFNKAVKISNDCDNIKSCCFAELGLICFFENDINGAIHETLKGIDVYSPQGDRKYILDVLKMNLATYYLQQLRVGEAQKILDETDPETITKVDARLKYYNLRTKVCSILKLYEDAINYAFEGIENARMSANHLQVCEILTTLASVYIEKGLLEDAEECIRDAVSLEDLVNDKAVLATTHTTAAKIFLQRKDRKTAKLHAERARQIAAELDDKTRLVSSLIMIGDISHEVETYLEGLNISRKLNLKKHEYKICTRLADILSEREEKEAIKYVKYASSLRKEIDTY